MCCDVHGFKSGVALMEVTFAPLNLPIKTMQVLVNYSFPVPQPLKRQITGLSNIYC